MDKWQAVNKFWNSFDLIAYDENSVPDDAVMPYITYNASIGSLNDPLFLSASLWYYTSSWVEISQKAEEISNYIGSGAGVPYDDGRLWITQGTPFAQRMSEPGSNFAKRIVLQINAEFH